MLLNKMADAEKVLSSIAAMSESICAQAEK